MSYTLREALEERGAQLQAYKTAFEKYPDARLTRLPNGEEAWVSESVKQPSDFVIVADSRGWPQVCGFDLVRAGPDIAGVRVFVPEDAWEHIGVFMQCHPEVHDQIVATLVKGRNPR